MYIFEEGAWNDNNCNERTEYICQMPISNQHPKARGETVKQKSYLNLSQSKETQPDSFVDLENPEIDVTS